MSTAPGGEAGNDSRAGGEPTGRAAGLQLKDLVPLAAVPLAFAAALLGADDVLGVLVVASVGLAGVMVVMALFTSRRGLRLVSWGTFAVLLCTAVVAAGVRADRRSEQPEPVVGPTSTPGRTSGAFPGTTTPVPVPSSPTPVPSGSGTAASPCVRSFRPAACSQTRTMLRMALQPCTTASLFATWGLRTDLDVLLIRTEQHGGVCYVGAAPPAASAVTGNDLRQAANGHVAAGLRACYLADSNALIPCSARHTGELIGDWRPDDGASHGPACTAAAQRYVGTTLGVDAELQPKDLDGTGQYRCAVTSRSALFSTVRDLGGAALPTLDAG